MGYNQEVLSDVQAAGQYEGEKPDTVGSTQ